MNAILILAGSENHDLYLESIGSSQVMTAEGEWQPKCPTGVRVCLRCRRCNTKFHGSVEFGNPAEQLEKMARELDGRFPCQKTATAEVE